VKKSLRTKLRIRFVVLTLLGLFLMQSVIVGLSIWQNLRDLEKKSDQLISQLYHHTSGASRYFSVKMPAGKETLYPVELQNVSVTSKGAVEMARWVLDQKEERGFIGGYRYHVYQNESGTVIYFLSREVALETCRIAAENLVGISVLGLGLIGVALIPLSRWVVRPIVVNHRKQKEFITSAGHELKTPLTVISTQAQLLKSEIGENPWLTGMEKEIEHLTELTHQLVALSRAEEYENPLHRERFSFSRALEEVAEVYAVIAGERGIKMTKEIPEGLEYWGSRTEIQQLLQILLDNACKYCPQGGSLELCAKGGLRGVHLAVTNSTDPIPPSQEGLLLHRFSRGANAEGKSGFGLGLSLARSIAERHGGRLTVFVTHEGEFRAEVNLH